MGGTLSLTFKKGREFIPFFMPENVKIVCMFYYFMHWRVKASFSYYVRTFPSPFQCLSNKTLNPQSEPEGLEVKKEHQLCVPSMRILP